MTAPQQRPPMADPVLERLLRDAAAGRSAAFLTRACNALENLGIDTFDKLRATDPFELLQARMVGPTLVRALWNLAVWPSVYSERDALRAPDKRLGI